MDRRIKIKKAFVVDTVLRDFYTGGVIDLLPDGSKLLCQCKTYITVVDAETGSVLQTIPPNADDYSISNEDENFEDPVITFSYITTTEKIVSYHKSGLLKLWNLNGSELLKSWKSVHNGPVAKLAFNKDGSQLATGGTDGTIALWDEATTSCLMKFRKLSGVISTLAYHAINEEDILFATGSDCTIYGWKYENGKLKQCYSLTGHFSVVTQLIFSNDGQFLVTCSREKTMMCFNLKSQDPKEPRLAGLVPTFESLEAGTILPDCMYLCGHKKPVLGLLVATGGEQGIVRIWDVMKKKSLYEYKNSDMNRSITRLIFNSQRQLLVIVRDSGTISLHNLDNTLSLKKQLIGNKDDILDVTYYGENESHLAVATNSCNITLYDETMNCTLLYGHTDIVVCLETSDKFSDLLVSGSKDNSVRVWKMFNNEVNCIAVGSRHIDNVTSVAISHKSCPPFVVSSSEDRTIKLWHLQDLKFKKTEQLDVSRTTVAHEKYINSVCISPNEDIIATGSQDKTAKLWSVPNLSLIGTLKGHRRGLWCVKFSPKDRVLLSSSADGTLRLWSLADQTCLKTLEGHSCSVLKCVFINEGTQIVSSGSDGLVKVWLIKTGECVTTMDKHTDRVWALCVNSENTKIVTGGSDSNLIIWRDSTEEEIIKEANKQREVVEQEQQLSNLLQAKLLLPALELSLTLRRPGQALKIMQSIVDKEEDSLRELLKKLHTSQKELLLDYACAWNTNSKTYYVAQVIFSELKDDLLSGKLSISNKALEGILAYTERHFKRVTEMVQDAQFLLYMEKQMKPHSAP